MMNVFFRGLLISLHLIVFHYGVSHESQESIHCLKCDELDELIIQSKSQLISKEEKILILDECYKTAKTLKNDSLRTLYFYKISNNLLKLNEYQKFRILSDEFLVLARKSNDSMRIADYYWNMGYYYSRIEASDSALYNFKKAGKIFKEVGHRYYEAKMDYNMAYILRRSKNYIESEAYAFKSISKLRLLDKKILLYRNFNHLGLLYYDMKQFELSQEYHLKALNISHKISTDNIYKERSLNNLSLVYQKQKKYDLAIETIDKALLNEGLISNNPNLYAKLIDNRAFCIFLKGDKEGVLESFNEALNIRKDLENEAGVVISRSHLSQYYLKEKDSIRAYNEAQMAYDISKRLRMNRDILESLKLLSKTNPSKASQYMAEYAHLNDSLVHVERQIRDKFTRIQFETDNYIADNENLKKKNIWISLTSGLALFSLSLFFFLYRQRSKNKRLLLESEQHSINEEIYDLMLKNQNRTEEGRLQERVRISQELHDGILARLFSIRIGLGFLRKVKQENDQQQYDSFLKELQVVEKEIRTLSHQLKSDELSSKKDFIFLLTLLLKEQSRVGRFKYQLRQDQSIAWDNVDEVIKINFYRIVQEAIYNIIKYADAQEVKLSLTRENEFFELQIVDDGIGFDTNKKKKGIGLRNMRSRSVSIGATIHIESNIGTGSSIKVRIPTKTLYHEAE